MCSIESISSLSLVIRLRTIPYCLVENNKLIEIYDLVLNFILTNDFLLICKVINDITDIV